MSFDEQYVVMGTTVGFIAAAFAALLYHSWVLALQVSLCGLQVVPVVMGVIYLRQIAMRSKSETK